MPADGSQSATSTTRAAATLVIAYQVLGDAPADVVFVPFFGSIRVGLGAAYAPAERIASVSRLILFDKRGTGLSDRPRSLTLERRWTTFARCSTRSTRNVRLYRGDSGSQPGARKRGQPSAACSTFRRRFLRTVARKADLAWATWFRAAQEFAAGSVDARHDA